MTNGLHIATQVTSVLAAATTVLATTSLFPVGFIYPSFLFLQIAILVLLFVASTLPPIPSVRLRIVTFVLVQADLAWLGTSRGLLTARLGVGAWWQQILVGFITWGVVVGGVLSYAIDISALIPYLLGKRGSSATTRRRLEEADAEEKMAWPSPLPVLTPMVSPRPKEERPLSPGADSPRNDSSSVPSPVTPGEFSPYQDESIRFSESDTSFLCSPNRARLNCSTPRTAVNPPSVSFPRGIYPTRRRNPSVASLATNPPT